MSVNGQRVSENQNLCYREFKPRTRLIRCTRVGQGSWEEKEENRTFAIGHLAFGYISSKTSASLLKTRLNIPIILALSVLPDIDLLLFRFIQHRGPTHSVISALVLFAPLFVAYRKQAIPYFVALAQHSLVGDYIGGGNVQLLWPAAGTYFGAGLDIRSPTSVTIELLMFVGATILMLLMKDMQQFFHARKSNFALIIPAFTVLPAIVLFTHVPISLILPSIFYFTLFSAAILIELYRALTNDKNTHQIKTTTEQTSKQLLLNGVFTRATNQQQN
jgi:membrane-bound metal-dependent hydrolase YbcI (DUF457 family)